uniref:Uncharacterized protein n=1 Tax=Anguilla anguilla TaxID=7936 RepID=A0A0E9X451_ANGAN
MFSEVEKQLCVILLLYAVCVCIDFYEAWVSELQVICSKTDCTLCTLSFNDKPCILGFCPMYRVQKPFFA